MEVRINKEVRNYQESLFFGLSLRQLLFALLAVAVAVGVYFGLRPVLGNGEIGWVCVLVAFPFALGGFFQYNGMTLERFLLAYIRSEFLFPRRLVFKSDNIYAKALENSTIREAPRLHGNALGRTVDSEDAEQMAGAPATGHLQRCDHRRYDRVVRGGLRARLWRCLCL